MTMLNRAGPMAGHWADKLGIIDSSEDGESFTSNNCTSKGLSTRRTTIRSSNNASNLYTPLKQVHPEVYSIFLPIIQSRLKNKRRHSQISTLDKFIDSTRQTSTNDSLVKLFTERDISLNAIENASFREFFRCLNPE